MNFWAESILAKAKREWGLSGHILDGELGSFYYLIIDGVKSIGKINLIHTGKYENHDIWSPTLWIYCTWAIMYS